MLNRWKPDDFHGDFRRTDMMAWKLLLVLGISATVSAAEHRHAGKHAHGEGTLNIAVDGKTAVIELRAPAESVYGFEHEAKTDADEKKRDEGLDLLKSRIDQMVILEAAVSCRFASARVFVVVEGHRRASSEKSRADKSATPKRAESAEHREVIAEFSVACEKPLSGSAVRFGFNKIFPKLETLRVQVLGENKQTGATVRKDKGSVRL
jgi:hypothetical protein